MLLGTAIGQAWNTRRKRRQVVLSLRPGVSQHTSLLKNGLAAIYRDRQLRCDYSNAGGGHRERTSRRGRHESPRSRPRKRLYHFRLCLSPKLASAASRIPSIFPPASCQRSWLGAPSTLLRLASLASTISRAPDITSS